MNTHRMTPGTQCPACGYEMDAVTELTTEGTLPKPGDFSLCVKCSQPLRFDNSLKLIAISTFELARLSRHYPETIELLEKARAKVEEINEERDRRESSDAARQDLDLRQGPHDAEQAAESALGEEG